MARLLFILVPLAVAFWIYSVVDCAMQPPARHRGVAKPAWMVIVTLIPIVGGVLWLTIGRARASEPLPLRGPDDDVAFLEGIGSQSDQDERIRRLEAELAQLDAEDDDPRWRHLESGSADAPDDDAQSGDSDSDGDVRGQRGAIG
ncbi:MAG: PLDc N-terminal domain-containing protein [Microbacterium sp.]|uniref:PLDc N-terminal domain-containing protein n=1 Tax=Microbacterium sp. TaxID=51671 RepID=UPI0039E3EFEE